MGRIGIFDVLRMGCMCHLSRRALQDDELALLKVQLGRQGEVVEALGSRIGAVRKAHDGHVEASAEVRPACAALDSLTHRAPH